MFKSRKNQDGIGVLELLLVVVIVTVALFIGWYVWNTYKHKDDMPAPSTNSQTESQADETELQSSSDETIVTIKELGVQMSVSDTIKDLIYKIHKGKFKNGKKYIEADISTSSLESLDKKCGTASAPLARIYRSEGTYPEKPTKANGADGLLKIFDTFYLTNKPVQNVCSKKDNVAALLDLQMPAINQALSTVAEIN